MPSEGRVVTWGRAQEHNCSSGPDRSLANTSHKQCLFQNKGTVCVGVELNSSGMEYRRKVNQPGKGLQSTQGTSQEHSHTGCWPQMSSSEQQPDGQGHPHHRVDIGHTALHYGPL